MVTAKKARLDAAKTVSKNAFHKKLKQLENRQEIKSLKKNVKQNFMPAANSRNVEETFIPPEKRQEILNELRQVL